MSHIHGPMSDDGSAPEDIRPVKNGDVIECANCQQLWSVNHYCDPVEDDSRSGMGSWYRFGR